MKYLRKNLNLLKTSFASTLSLRTESDGREHHQSNVYHPYIKFYVLIPYNF